MSVSEMVERVAMAACKAGGSCPCEEGGHGVNAALCYVEVRVARAAIEAMRKPTPGIVRVIDLCTEQGGAEELWNMLIDAALAPPTDSASTTEGP